MAGAAVGTCGAHEARAVGAGVARVARARAAEAAPVPRARGGARCWDGDSAVCACEARVARAHAVRAEPMARAVALADSGVHQLRAVGTDVPRLAAAHAEPRTPTTAAAIVRA